MLNLSDPMILDGGMGTLLQQAGLAPGEQPERWNLLRPDDIIAIHRAYLEAGAQVMTTNTFGANRLKYPADGGCALADVIAAGLHCAKAAAGKRAAVALDIGPTGKLLAPLGPLAFEDAVAIFREIAEIGAANGADLLFIETMTDLLELRAAVIGCKEGAPGLPIFASFTVEENGRMLTGATPAAAAVMLESMGVAALGINCGAGPERARGIVPQLAAHCSVPVLAQPNAGLPEVCQGQTIYPLSPEEFARQGAALYSLGARLLGGCCGTTPAHIAALARALGEARGVKANACQLPAAPVICSASAIVAFAEPTVLIGERINPTGKPKFQQHLRAGNWDYLLDEALSQEQAGAQVLDVNLGLPGIDERAAMLEAVTRIQRATALPLQLDSASPAVLEAALRRYQGKALVNSVNGKEENMRAVFPLIQKYGGVVVALLLDEVGIPATAAGRMAIAEKIYATAAEYGLGKEDILIDALTMTVSAEPTGAVVTLDVMERIHAMGGYTVLGVSNISFGLPQREFVNAAFFTMAMQRGLRAAIINPKSPAMMAAYHAVKLLNNRDANAVKYLAFTESLPVQANSLSPSAAQAKAVEKPELPPLMEAILLGREEAALSLANAALLRESPLQIIQQLVIPALDEVGLRFAKGTLFLPQLLQSAAAAKAALALLQEKIRESGSGAPAKGAIVLATVRGDIHDIGKNIVKTLLETYHFEVTDLGKDVPPETVCRAVTEGHVPLCGLSALMTTTVPSMEATIRLLREKAPWCKVLVGGAVLTKAYADEIGADAYCADAMATVRAAEAMLSGAAG